MAVLPAVIDHRTEAGRAQIDKAVKSLVDAGIASSDGERGQTTYRKAPKA